MFKPEVLVESVEQLRILEFLEKNFNLIIMLMKCPFNKKSYTPLINRGIKGVQCTTINTKIA